MRTEGDVPVEVDLRTAGAVGAYSSAGMPLDQRGTGLLADVLSAISERPRRCGAPGWRY